MPLLARLGSALLGSARRSAGAPGPPSLGGGAGPGPGAAGQRGEAAPPGRRAELFPRGRAGESQALQQIPAAASGKGCCLIVPVVEAGGAVRKGSGRGWGGKKRGEGGKESIPVGLGVKEQTSAIV